SSFGTMPSLFWPARKGSKPRASLTTHWLSARRSSTRSRPCRCAASLLALSTINSRLPRRSASTPSAYRLAPIPSNRFSAWPSNTGWARARMRVAWRFACPPFVAFQPGKKPQGHLVFQYNPDESQRLCRLGRQLAASCRNVRIACPPQQANRGVAERRHDLGDVATAHLGAVFIEGHIAHPMR